MTPVPRLIHLNGPPGIGKSTLAARYAADHHGTLNCDIDVLRTLIGGWQSDFVGAGGLIRPAALAMIGAYLREGNDVVLPQLIANASELRRFEQCAEEAGASFVERILIDDEDAAVARFAQRGSDQPENPWHDQVREIVAAQGGEEALRETFAKLRNLAQLRSAVLIPSLDGDVEATYAALLSSLADSQ